MYTSGLSSCCRCKRNVYKQDYEREPAAGGGSQAENSLAAQLAGIPDINTEELEALLRDLPTLDDANQAAGMTRQWR